MNRPSDGPRIAPVPLGGGDDPAARELLAPLGERADSNFFRTLARHPKLFRRWAPYGHSLFQGTLPARDRELVILRSAHRSESPYLWGQHRAIARTCDLDDDDIERVREPATDAGWSSFETALLRATDQMIDDHDISDPVWRALADRYADHQLLELPMVVAFYYGLGITFNAIRLQLED